MREIKFRGIREKTGEWVYGYLVEREEPFLHDIVVPIGNSSSCTWAIKRGSEGQYTGLKDKNGVDIYEYNELDGAYEVIFKDLKYSLRHISNNDIIGLQDYWRDKNGEIEVTREYTKV